MVTAHSTWNSILANRSEEELKDGVGAVVVMISRAGDLTAIAIDECMIDQLPTNQTWHSGIVSS